MHLAITGVQVVTATTHIRTGIGVTGGITTGTIDKTLGYTCRDSYLLNTESGRF
jgi:hypothetical protein